MTEEEGDREDEVTGVVHGRSDSDCVVGRRLRLQNTGVGIKVLASLLGAGLGNSHADLRIDGDETLVEELQSILSNLRPDFGEPLARLIGDQSAEDIAGFLELGGRALRHLAEDLGNEGTRAARAAAHRQFVDTRALDRFSEQILALQLATDRLGARVQQLKDSPDAGP